MFLEFCHIVEHPSLLGPIATIIAAAVAASVAGYFAYKQYKISAQQMKYSEEKLRLDLFDRRLEILYAADAFMRASVRLTGSEEPQIVFHRYLNALETSKFLFPQNSGVHEKLQELGSFCTQLNAAYRKNEEENGDDKHKEGNIYSEARKINMPQLVSCIKELSNIMRPYVQFDKY